MPVEWHDGYLVCRWLVGPRRNLIAEEFALRLIRETGCRVIDREHARAIDPAELAGLEAAPRRPLFERVLWMAGTVRSPQGSASDPGT
jgi:hypothetical protein